MQLNTPAMTLFSAHASDWLSPQSRQPLRVETAYSLVGPGERWPVVEGIPYLRTGREALVADTLHLLDEGRDDEALALLLGDQDDWARTPPATGPDRSRA